MGKKDTWPAEVEKALKKLPKDPGVYQYFDDAGDILYVGKAKNLRNRVRSYFQKSANHAPRTKKLISKVADITWTTVRTEAEALALEANLIHEQNPPFNVLLRDDKHFLYLKITKDPFARVLFTRYMKKGDGTYFGPYVKASHIRKTVDFLREILAFRTCKVVISEKGETIRNPENRKIPCLDYQIKHCSGPCNAHITQEKYQEDIEELISFLRGNATSLQKRLQKEMLEAAQKKEFERAARFRDLVLSLEGIQSKQAASLPEDFSADIVGMSFGAAKSFFCVLFVRHGKILRLENFSMQNEGDSESTLLAFLREFLSSLPENPPLLLVPESFPEEEKETWEEFLEMNNGRKTEVRIPQKGSKKELMDIAEKNARMQASNSRASFEEDNPLSNLQKALSLTNKPERIECYDISHLGGTHTVASQVVFLDGEPAKSEYRHYKVKTVPDGKPDDFASMAEVLERRLSRLKEQASNINVKTVQKKSEQKKIAKQFQKELPEKIKYYNCTNEETGEHIGYVCSAKRGQSFEILGGIPKKQEHKEDMEGVMIQAILLREKEKTARIVLGEKEFRRRVAFENIGWKEEKKPPKSFTEEKTVTFKMDITKLKKASKKMPDLLVIDGGKGQLSAVVKVLKKLDLFKKIPVCSLAKREEEVFVPGKKFPLGIPKDTPENKLLQRIRDEAHRFAITYNRNLRKKAETHSLLDDIPGIGTETKKVLLQTFGSPKAIFAASDAELLNIVSGSVLKNIRDTQN